MHDALEEGTRFGRFVVVKDVDSRTHALSTTSVAAMCEGDEGVLLMLPGGKMVRVEHSLKIILDWFDGGRGER